ncbi:MAG TPA: hypothetical protein VKY74_02705, partial [Chloroflexia bacterium]|nr:hypothetical protein [Chloroflexia bacterium]
MGYFRADERYLGPAAEAPVAAPWGVGVAAAGAPGCLRVGWRRPYTAVDSYAVLGRPATDPGAAQAWRELAQVPGGATEALIQPAPGTWQLIVVARRGGIASPPSAIVCGLAGGPDEGSGVGGQGSDARPP